VPRLGVRGEGNQLTDILWQWALPGMAVLTASLLQSAVGFGYTLFLLPLLLVMGYAPFEIVVVTAIVSSLAQRIFILTHLHRAVDWRTLAPMMLIGLAAIPMGICLLCQVSSQTQSTIKQIIGGCILLLLLLQWFGRVAPRDSISRGWGYLAAFFSGLLTGFANIGGPPMALWLLAHRWSNEKMRITIPTFSLAFVPVQLVMLLMIFGRPVLEAGGKAIIFTPAVLLGAWLGLRAGGKLNKRQLRLAVHLLLLTVAMIAVLGSFFKG